jgi:hypothetical protein
VLEQPNAVIRLKEKLLTLEAMSEKRIKWQPGFTLSKKPTRRATARRATWKVNAPAQFQSVAETSGARYEPAISLSHTVTSKAFQLGGLAADSVNDVAAQSSSCDSDEHVWSPLGVLYNSLSHRYEPVIRRCTHSPSPITTHLMADGCL